MQHPITRETWHAAAKEVGLRLETIAAATGKSYSAVYRYTRGERNPSEAWLAEVAALIERHREEHR
jgi:transcriptional regulator with XRE-family HTH domain